MSAQRDALKEEVEYYSEKVQDRKYQAEAVRDDLSDTLSSYSQDEDRHIKVITADGIRHS